MTMCREWQAILVEETPRGPQGITQETRALRLATRTAAVQTASQSGGRPPM